jgi:tartrate-resistant acid phosphatase type 5
MSNRSPKPHHREKYVYLAGLTHNSVLIAWGTFFFKRDGDNFELIDDEDLKDYDRERKSSIGFGSDSYGNAKVEIFDTSGTIVATATTNENHVEIAGLLPDTTYTYEVQVGGKSWTQGDLFTYSKKRKSLVKSEAQYKCIFTTFPSQNQSADLNFAILGDFGSRSEIQYRVAQAMEKAVDEHQLRILLTVGDNIYRKRFFNPEGDEDDDWLLTYFQPYRHVINRIPVFPAIGNHDADESEDRDDRSQLYTNFYVQQRFLNSEDCSISPGLFYRFRYGSDIEFICIDTSKATDDDLPNEGFEERFYQYPKHKEFLETVLKEVRGTKWRIPFCHHPPYSKGTDHGDTKDGMYELAKLCETHGVKAFFSGHSHSFQHFESRNNGNVSHYFVSGGGGKPKEVNIHKNSRAELKHFGGGNEGHFLIVKIAGNSMQILPIGEYRGKLRNLPLKDANENDSLSTITVIR